MNKRKSKLEIINETVEYYSKDVSRRAIDEKTMHCCYITNDKKMCAVGRCLKREDLEKVRHETTGADDIIYHFSDTIFKPRYQGHEPNFWNKLQYFHDCDSFWNKNGLTEKGKSELEKMKNEWSENTLL